MLLNNVLISVLVTLLSFCTIFSQVNPKIGIRGGIGTDINLGLAYGIGANYLVDLKQNPVELGILFFGGKFSESTDQGMHTYDEKTGLSVFGIMANYLMQHDPDNTSLFFVAGFGLASISVEWEERSSTDSSLGTPLSGGGSMQSSDGSAGGTVFNLGIGKCFNKKFDCRLEIPVILTFAPPGSASSVIPTLIATAGYRF